MAQGKKKSAAKKSTKKTTPPMDDFRQRAEEFQGEYAPAVVFEIGDMVVGKVLRFSRNNTKYGPYPIVVLEDEDSGDEISVHALHTTLKSQLAKARVRIGDRIAVKRLEDRVSKSTEESYHVFHVMVDRENEDELDMAEYMDSPTDPAGISPDDDDLPF